MRGILLLVGLCLAHVVALAQCNLGTGVTTVPSLPYSSGSGTTCGAVNDLTSSNTLVCGSTLYYGGEDRVWIFTPASSGQVNVAVTSTGTWTGLMVYEGCPLNGQGGTCKSFAQSSAGNQQVSLCVTAGSTYYVVLDVFPAPNCNPYTNLTISAPAPPGACNLGTGVNTITLPYTSNGRTTCGKIDDLTASNVTTCGSTSYLSGEDEVFVFTPTVSGNITISISSAGSYTGLMLYAGCPLTTNCSGGGGATCVAFEQSSTGSKSLCANVVAGTTYYLIVDSWASPACNPYNITISAPQGLAPGATCSNAYAIPSLPFGLLNETTACMGNDYSGASTGACASSYQSGEDKVYRYIAAGPECLGITLTGASSNLIGFQVYAGCPGTTGTTCIGTAGGANAGTLTGSVVLPSAGTYYIIVDSWAPPANASYNISISSFGSGPPNDLPCNAIAAANGVYYSGDNNCSGFSLEPSSPTCWTTGNRNTVWYTAVVPASGQLRVKVVPVSLTNTQIAVYSGTCSSLVQIGCNDNAASCGSTTNPSSELLLNALVPGTTVYVAVDGANDLVGTFGFLVSDGAQPVQPLTNGQDCGYYLPVCDTSISYGDPGFQVFGNICDFPGGGTNCLASGERGSAWFSIPINANGNLEFTIIPNDWPGAPSTVGTDYDFAIWKIGGSGAVTCAQIASGSAPVRCNYNFLGVTGCFSAANGTAPGAYPGFGPAFQSQLPVTNGDVYALVVSNFTSSTSGFRIIFNQTAPVAYGAAGNASVWTGGLDTDWYKEENWGGCPVPTCSRDAIINGGIVTQPVIGVTGASCKSILINAGANLTLNNAVVLSVCENFTNNGRFSAHPGSTVSFSNAAVNQSINGNLVTTNAFGNLLANKTGGLVTMTQDLDCKSAFTLQNVTTSFTTTGRTHKVAGNFSNYGTYTPSTGTLWLNGAAAQTYYNNGSLNNLVMNHTGPGATLATNMTTGPAGIVTLTSGKIITTAAFEVSVTNRAPAAMTTGNTTSYVEGRLRRYLLGTGSYDFPVGHAAKGYQRMNINYAYPALPTSNDNLLVTFAPYAAVPGPLNVTDCAVLYSGNALNNGSWSVVPSGSVTSGNFDLTLYNTNYTNATTNWTVMQNSGGAWTLGGGVCAPSVATAVRRTAMTTLAEFGTAQGISVLPVSLLGPEAIPGTDKIRLEWTTTSEMDNRGFEIQRSCGNDNSFTPIGWSDGHGTSNVQHAYFFDDVEVVKDKLYYYRLVQKDYNGQEHISGIVSARINRNAHGVFLHPNPVDDAAFLKFAVAASGGIHVTVYNMLGARVGETMELEAAGRNELALPGIKELPYGTYCLVVLVEGEAIPLRFVRR